MWGGEWPLHHNARKYWFTHFTADMQRSTTADVEEKVGVGGGGRWTPPPRPLDCFKWLPILTASHQLIQLPHRPGRRLYTVGGQAGRRGEASERAAGTGVGLQ